MGRSFEVIQVTRDKVLLYLRYSLLCVCVRVCVRTCVGHVVQQPRKDLLFLWLHPAQIGWTNTKRKYVWVCVSAVWACVNNIKYLVERRFWSLKSLELLKVQWQCVSLWWYFFSYLWFKVCPNGTCHTPPRYFRCHLLYKLHIIPFIKFVTTGYLH